MFRTKPFFFFNIALCQRYCSSAAFPELHHFTCSQVAQSWQIIAALVGALRNIRILRHLQSRYSWNLRVGHKILSVFPQTSQAMPEQGWYLLYCSLNWSYPTHSAMHSKATKCERHDNETAWELQGIFFYNIRQFICKMSAIKKKKKKCLKYNIQNSAIKILYLTMINQHIKNMSLREEVLLVEETRFVMWS